MVDTLYRPKTVKLHQLARHETLSPRTLSRSRSVGWMLTVYRMYIHTKHNKPTHVAIRTHITNVVQHLHHATVQEGRNDGIDARNDGIDATPPDLEVLVATNTGSSGRIKIEARYMDLGIIHDSSISHPCLSSFNRPTHTHSLSRTHTHTYTWHIDVRMLINIELRLSLLINIELRLSLLVHIELRQSLFRSASPRGLGFDKMR